MRNYQRLDDFLNERVKDIYPEPFGEPSISITNETVPKIIEIYKIPPGARVLDVGCGHGTALQAFKKAGCEVVGVSLGPEAAKCKKEGFQVLEADMSFLDLDSGDFDVIWCRHVLEHSIFPYFTLSEMFRLLKSGGVFYMEVPAAETSLKHETNPNHYSVLSKNGWLSLLLRIGFKEIQTYDIEFLMPVGPEKYFAYLAQKN